MTQEFTVFVDKPQVNRDRRAAKRYRCGLATLVPMHVDESSPAAEAWACNLATGGISLNLPHPMEAGTTSVVRLSGQQPVVSMTMRARVVHSTEQIDGTWRIGCAFEKQLDLEMLEALL
jgi:hypothetical protein